MPRVVATVREADAASTEAVANTVDALLGADADLVVRVEIGAAVADDDRARLRERFDPDPRVRVAATRSALDEFAASPLHVGVDPGPLPRGLLRRLRAKLGTAVAGEARLDDGRRASICRAWALHRVARAGGRVGDYGDVVAFSAESRAGALVRRALVRLRPAGREARRMAAVARARAARVGDIASVPAFLGWVAERVRNRVAPRRGR